MTGYSVASSRGPQSVASGYGYREQQPPKPSRTYRHGGRGRHYQPFHEPPLEEVPNDMIGILDDPRLMLDSGRVVEETEMEQRVPVMNGAESLDTEYHLANGGSSAYLDTDL